LIVWFDTQQLQSLCDFLFPFFPPISGKCREVIGNNSIGGLRSHLVVWCDTARLQSLCVFLFPFSFLFFPPAQVNAEKSSETIPLEDDDLIWSFGVMQHSSNLHVLFVFFHLPQVNAEKLSETIPVEDYDLIWSFGVIHHR